MKIRIRKNIRRMIKITIVASYVKENLTIFMTKKYKVLYQESWQNMRYTKSDKIIKG